MIACLTTGESIEPVGEEYEDCLISPSPADGDSPVLVAEKNTTDCCAFVTDVEVITEESSQYKGSVFAQRVKRAELHLSMPPQPYVGGYNKPSGSFVSCDLSLSPDLSSYSSSADSPYGLYTELFEDRGSKSDLPSEGERSTVGMNSSLMENAGSCPFAIVDCDCLDDDDSDKRATALQELTLKM